MLRSHLHPHVSALTFVCIDAHCILSALAVSAQLCLHGVTKVHLAHVCTARKLGAYVVTASNAARALLLLVT